MQQDPNPFSQISDQSGLEGAKTFQATKVKLFLGKLDASGSGSTLAKHNVVAASGQAKTSRKEVKVAAGAGRVTGKPSNTGDILNQESVDDICERLWKNLQAVITKTKGGAFKTDAKQQYALGSLKQIKFDNTTLETLSALHAAIKQKGGTPGDMSFEFGLKNIFNDLNKLKSLLGIGANQDGSDYAEECKQVYKSIVAISNGVLTKYNTLMPLERGEANLAHLDACDDLIKNYFKDVDLQNILLPKIAHLREICPYGRGDVAASPSISPSSDRNSADLVVSNPLAQAETDAEAAEWAANAEKIQKYLQYGDKSLSIKQLNLHPLLLNMIHAKGLWEAWEAWEASKRSKPEMVTNFKPEMVTNFLFALDNTIFFYRKNGVKGKEIETVKSCYKFSNLLCSFGIDLTTGETMYVPTFWMFRFFEFLMANGSQAPDIEHLDPIWIKIFAAAMLSMNMGELEKLIDNMLRSNNTTGLTLLNELMKFFKEVIRPTFPVVRIDNWYNALHKDRKLIRMLALNFLIVSDFTNFRIYLDNINKRFPNEPEDYCYLNFSGLNFCGMKSPPLFGDFSRISFCGALLDGADFSKCDISYCNFTGVSCGCVDWRKVQLESDFEKVFKSSVKYSSEPQSPLDLSKYAYKTKENTTGVLAAIGAVFNDGELADVMNGFIWTTLPPSKYAQGLYILYPPEIIVANGGFEIFKSGGHEVVFSSSLDTRKFRHVYLNDINQMLGRRAQHFKLIFWGRELNPVPTALQISKKHLQQRILSLAPIIISNVPTELNSLPSALVVAPEISQQPMPAGYAPVPPPAPGQSGAPLSKPLPIRPGGPISKPLPTPPGQQRPLPTTPNQPNAMVSAQNVNLQPRQRNNSFVAQDDPFNRFRS